MRICLASLHPRRLSGQIESLVALGRELERHGHTVQLVSALEGLGLPEKQAPSARLERGATSFGKLWTLLASAARLASMSRDADIIHVNLPTPAFSLVADLLATWTRGRAPIVVGFEAHLADVRRLLSDGSVWQDPRFYVPRVLINNGVIARRALFRGQRYVVSSQWQTAELVRVGVPPERVVVLPNLFESWKLRPISRDDARSELFGHADEAPVIGWAGHFHHVKGLDVLLEAFRQILHERAAARLALAWSGIGYPRSVNKRIAMLGISRNTVRLGQVDMSVFFSAVNVLALPYRLTIGQGAYPNLVLEAMATGVPLVTSDLPLLRELTRGEAAVLTWPNDASSLKSAIMSLLDDPERSRRLMDAQRELMDGALSPRSLGDRYAALYDEVLAEHHGSV